MNKLLIVVILSLVSSCATVTNAKIKNDVAKRLFDLFDKYTSEISDTQIASVADRKPRLEHPFDLAIYFKPPGQKENWRWSAEDRRNVMAVVDQNKKLIKRSFELINTSDNSEDLKSLRMMAAEQGADALLVIQGSGDVKTPANGLAVTYIALAPMLFINGNNVKSGFVTQAVLWDVRQSYVHMGIQSEGDWSMKRPLIFSQKERALLKAKEESLDQLEKQMKEKLRQMI